MSNKLRQKKVIKRTVKHDYESSVKILVEKQDALTHAFENKMKEMATKHNSMAAAVQACEDLMKRVVAAVSSEIGQMMGRMQVISQECDRTLTGMDRNVLALAEISQEVFGQLSQVDFFLRKLAGTANMSLDTTETEAGAIKEEAVRWYKEVTVAAFERVSETLEKDAQERVAQQAAEQTAKEEAEKAALEVEEQDRVEEEMKNATREERSVAATLGGPGVAIPDGVDVFGGA
jgi:hypothetical protein